MSADVTYAPEDKMRIFEESDFVVCVPQPSQSRINIYRDIQ